MGWLPKITIGKKIDQSIGKVFKDVAIKPIVEQAKFVGEAASGIIGAVTPSVNDALTSVGTVLSNPAAAPVIGATGTAFGIPGLGSLASQFSQWGNSAADSVKSIVVPGPSGENKNILIFGGIGAVFLLVVMTLVIKNKR